jgi:hypothetical protein
MDGTTLKIDQVEEDILSYDVSDDALEAAACNGSDKPAALTVAMCSGFDSCPA